jgi:glycolate oxidase FAD binding subunit
MRPMPSPIDTIQDQLRAAAADGRVLRVVGHGSKDFYGNPLRGEPLPTTDLRGVLAYEPTELVITALAGTPLAELQATLADKGQFLPFEPPLFNNQGTVGGMVAAGVAGSSRASVGGVRDYVLGVEILNGRAQRLRYGGQVMKNVAGYDVSRLMTGSLGTLAVITEVSLKVLPLPVASATLHFEVPAAQALHWLARWRAQPLPLWASHWVQHDGGGHLYLRLRGAAAAVQAAQQRLLQQAQAEGYAAQALSAEADATDWEAARHQILPFFVELPNDQACLWRLSVPPNTGALAELPPQLIDWHGTQRWLWASAAHAEPLRQAARAVGGHATMVRASRAHPEADKALGVFDTPQPAAARIGARLRQAFDPHGVLNTQRLPS